jgi:uncharacterized protein (DUF697 family)
MSVSRKKLPNAIMHPIDGLREAAADDGSKEWRGTPMSMMASNQVTDGRSAAPQSGPLADVIDVTQGTQAFSTPVAATLARTKRTSTATNVAKRQAQARAIVARHAAYSAVSGIVPLPLANAAGITTIIIRMVKMLSDLYGVPFERDRARAIVVGLVGGTVPSGFAAVTTSTLFYVVPSGTLMGLAVSSITAVACTRSIGRIFIEHFESGATLHDLSANEAN